MRRANTVSEQRTRQEAAATREKNQSESSLSYFQQRNDYRDGIWDASPSPKIYKKKELSINNIRTKRKLDGKHANPPDRVTIQTSDGKGVEKPTNR